MTSLPKILLVDDKAANLTALESFLSPLPVQLFKADSGDEALRLTLRHTFALAILDVQMPNMDGYELAKLLRLDERSQNTPIIFLSAVYSDDHHQFMGYRSGAVDFITKPFNPEFMLHKVNVFLELYNRREELADKKRQLEILLEEQCRTNTELSKEISNRRAVESQLLVAKERAETLSKAKSDFLATMSHEIRTPLNGIMGMLQLAQTVPMAPELKEYVDTALSSSRSLLRILSDILDISRVEAGSMHFEVEEFALDDIIQPVRLSFQDQAARQGITLAVQVDSGVPKRLMGDPGRLRQILFNLIGNSLKFTRNGSITLEVYALPYGTAPGCDCVHFAVTDTGLGIADDKVGEVFGLFTQIEGTFSRRYGGVGLGLAIVKRLVDLLGGSIAVRSELGRGTAVHITLPLNTAARRSQEAVPTPAAASTPAPARQNARILLVEDESINRLTAMRFLKHLGYEAMSAEDGHQALKLLAEENFDAVLMDVQMPGMDGLEATRRIRASTGNEFDPGIPIIAVTAHSMSGDRERFLNAGMDAYLPKPIEKEDLRLLLEQILTSKRHSS